MYCFVATEIDMCLCDCETEATEKSVMDDYVGRINDLRSEKVVLDTANADSSDYETLLGDVRELLNTIRCA